MSKFIELLERVGDTAPSPLGFAPATGRDVAPQMALVARVAVDDLLNDPGLAEANAQALLVETGFPLPDAAAGALKDRLWGVRLVPSPAACTVEQVEALVEQGCDFVVFESWESAAAVLNDEELGRVVVLEADADEETSRAAAGLPFDAVLLGPSVTNRPLTLGDLVAIQKVRQRAGQPFLIEAPEGLEQADVEALRNLGVDGLVVGVPPLERAAETEAAIRSLKRRRSRRGRSNALVPGASIEDDDHD